ncbi:hypothetical protein ACSBR2_042758 [Camellia fascicularis]
MDVLQAFAAATQIVSSMVGAVNALEQASRNLEQAPKRIHSLEEFVCDLENLTNRIEQKHFYKLHNPQLDRQLQSLNGLIERLRPNMRKARQVVSKSRTKKLAIVLWSSVTGSPLDKIVNSIRDELNWWLESQKLTEDVEKVIESTARNIPIRPKVKAEQGYPISSKCKFVRGLLEQETTHHVILIVGLSGIGKSCLARQVASDPPLKFDGGAVELGFGQWCSRAACNGNKDEYHKRLARRICKLLVQIGFWKKIKDENSDDLENICCLLQEALYEKSILILLDDVWEQDIVERFAKLYDNDCKYLVTTRNESVYEITEAEKVELSKDDIKEISKAVLLYHSLLKDDELPDVADNLLERCGHHPLTVAVMGKALRKEIRAEKWEKAISNLSTYAMCAPGPVSYVNEKEAENAVTIFGSFEFSLKAMPEDSRRLFLATAALSWAEPVPEACLEAVWSALGHVNMFPLVVCKLVEGSLLKKSDYYHLYQVHDMVSLYLDGKINDSLKILLIDLTPEGTAFISPWLFIFGKETSQKVAGQRIEFFLGVLEEKQAVITLEAITQAIMEIISISEFEASRASLSRIVGPKIANLISTDSRDLVAALAKAITIIFSTSDYRDYFPSLENIGAVEKFASILDNCHDPMIQTNVSTILAKLAEFGSTATVDKVLRSIPMNRLADLLSPNAKEWHDSIFTTLMSLTTVGKSKAVEYMFSFEIEKSLIKLLEVGSEVAQHNAIATLKAIYELGSPPANCSLRPGTLNLLPWQARLSLEKFVLSDRNITFAPKLNIFEDLVHKVLGSDKTMVLDAMQELIPVIEKAGDPGTRDMILQSPLVKRLSELLQHSNPNNSMRSQSAFLLMKLACVGGEPFIKKFLQYDIIADLVKMMQCSISELQDSAYTALHQMLFGDGGDLIMKRILQMGIVEKLVNSIEGKSAKTREVNVNCVLDIVELGNKACLEQMFALQLVEKLARVEKANGGTGESVVGFLKSVDKCKHLSMAERRLMKQQVVRKVRVTVKGKAQIIAAVDAFMSEGSKAASSSVDSGRK